MMQTASLAAEEERQTIKLDDKSQTINIMPATLEDTHLILKHSETSPNKAQPFKAID